MTQPRQPATILAGALAAAVVLTGTLTGASQGAVPAPGRAAAPAAACQGWTGVPAYGPGGVGTTLFAPRCCRRAMRGRWVTPPTTPCRTR